MDYSFGAAMRTAAQQTRARDLLAATRTIQAALKLKATIPGSSALPVALHARADAPKATASMPGVRRDPQLRAEQVRADPITDRRTNGSFTCSAGTRTYIIHRPPGDTTAPRGLLMMLHGCTQNPDDFAAGTGMNAVADGHSLVVVYPAQTRAHNASGCWNWFQTGDQIRDGGEPAILAGIARKLMAEHGFNREQVFIAGMSAGGAMAVIMAETYPDVFSAVGVHSGLPYQSAHNVMTALSAMRGRVKPRTSAAGNGVPAQPPVRTIIFHGTADKTVNPSNAADIVNDIVAHHPRNTAVIEDGQHNGKRFTRTMIADAGNRVVVESWHIVGSGHAWSGGSLSGSFADPTGPDASAEMVRFFLA